MYLTEHNAASTYDYLNHNIQHSNGIVSITNTDPEYRIKFNLYITAIVTTIFLAVNSALVSHYCHKWFGNVFTGADIIVQALVFALLFYIVINSVSPL